MIMSNITDVIMTHGAAYLTDMQILAILLRQGCSEAEAQILAGALLDRFENWLGLQRATIDEICTIPGMGEAKAVMLKAALDIGRRQLLNGPNQRLQITSPSDVANLLMLEMSALEKEHLRVVLLNTKNVVMGIETVTIGSLNSASVRVAEVFRSAIRRMAAAIIICHNHPSGQALNPSADDILLTKQIIAAGQLLDINVLDHLVIGAGQFCSMRERRLGWG
jgi:DNA repair protein RadC